MNGTRLSRRLISLAALIATCVGDASGQAAAIPPSVAACLAKHPEVELNQEQRPPYLKIRFRADGSADYVVAVTYREKHANRAMVCRAEGAAQVLGVPGAQPFSDMYNDDYMSSEWRRCSHAEVQRMTRNYRGVPATENEAVCMTWEDGESLIYERGGRILWKNLEP